MHVSQGDPVLSLSHLVLDFLHLKQALLDLIGGRLALEGLLALEPPAEVAFKSSPSGMI